MSKTEQDGKKDKTAFDLCEEEIWNIDSVR